VNLIKKYFSTDDLARITQAVQDVEKGTAGEIRVEIRQRRNGKEKGLSVEQIARHEFAALGMSKTRDRTGVLIFLLLEDRQFCILADEGIHSRVGQDPWTEIAGEMASSFKKSAFADGLIHAVEGIGSILKAYVPARPDDTNELSDDVGVR
jgi:uncharacterized membrane protein